MWLTANCVGFKDDDWAKYLQACIDETPDDRAAGFNSCWRHRTGAWHDATARGTGITREGLYKALGEQGNPSFVTVIKVMHALGLQFNVGARSMRGGV